MQLIDISPPIDPSLAVWPGDVPFRREVALDMKNGDNLTLSAIHASTHLGAHTDAPNHYDRDGADIASRPLELYYGSCQVVDVATPKGQRVLPEHVSTDIIAPRILLKTGSYPDPKIFNEDFSSCSPELIEWLHDQHVRLIGIDTPSIDLFDDKELHSHTVVARHDMAILEGIVLSHVSPGNYQLIALPLPIREADASPVRAVLVDVSP